MKTSPILWVQWRIKGSGLVGPGPPLIFRPNGGSKGWKKTFSETGSPSYLRVWMTAPPLPPPLPHLKVWIRHWVAHWTTPFALRWNGLAFHWCLYERREGWRLSFRNRFPIFYQGGCILYNSYTEKTEKRRNDQMVHNFPTSRSKRGK